MVQYFHLKDINTIGKIENNAAYIFDKSKGWVPDSRNRLNEWKEAPEKQPGYIMSAPPVLTLIQEISKDDAKRFMETDLI